jgi:hypothetical protein
MNLGDERAYLRVSWLIVEIAPVRDLRFFVPCNKLTQLRYEHSD